MAQQDLQCPFCPKVSTRGTGLASHIRGAHPKQYAGWKKARKSGAPVAVSARAAAPVSVTGSGFGDVVEMLEQQKVAIESALAALRGIGAAAVPSAALKRRWTERKAAGKRGPGRPKKA